MMASQKEDLGYKDLVVRSIRTIDGGLDSREYLGTKTRILQAEAEIQRINGAMDLGNLSLAELEAAMAGLTPPLPPTENVTNILLETTANADGSLHVEITWDYAPEDPETVPATIIAGCAIVYMSAGIIPAPPELTTKSVGRIIPMSGAGSYSWSGDFPARQIANDNNTFPIHYRFGIVAANASSGEVKIHADGIIDGGTDWRDIVSGSVISVDNGNFWNLVTGEFMATVGYDQSFHIDPVNEEAKLVNIPLSSYKGAGVNRTATRLNHDSLDWLDTPDTDPASDELLAARIGRLGVGGPVLLDGEFVTPIAESWAGETVIQAASSSFPSYIQLVDGSLRVAYTRSDNHLVERTWNGNAWGGESVINASGVYAEYIQLFDGQIRIAYWKFLGSPIVERIWNGTSWDAENIINAASEMPSYVQLTDGQLRVAYRRNSDGYLVERIWNGTSWDAESNISTAQVGYGSDYIQPADGQLRVAYNRNSDGYLVERIWNGTSWDAENIINAAHSSYPDYIQLATGQIRIAYRITASKYIAERTWNGSSWGAENIIHAGNTASTSSPSYVQLTDGQLRVAYNRESDNHLVERTLQRYAQLGAGIIESGSNSNGSYIKFSDGTMECWYETGVYAITATYHTTGYYNYAMSFIASPHVSWILGRPTASYQPRLVAIDKDSAQTRIVIESATSQNLSFIGYRAIGRWK